MKKTLTSVFLLMCIFSLEVVAQTAGSLDVSFSSDGKLTTSFGTTEVANAVAINPKTGIIYSVGTSGTNIAAYEQSGELRFAFSGDGKETTTLPNSSNAKAYAVAVQADGKIVVAGSYRSTLTDHFEDFFLARYLTNGNLDTGFDGDGIIQFHSSLVDFYYGLAIQPDGKIIAVGSQNSQFVIRRYLTNGVLDTGFGTAGTVSNIYQGEAKAVTLQSDNKILVIGRQFIIVNGEGSGDFAVIRLNTDGSLDTGFDTDGKLTTPIGSNSDDYAQAVAMQADGKIVVVGKTFNAGNYDIAVVRYNINGSLDTGFSSDGKFITTINSNDDGATAVAVQADGGIVVSGTTRTPAYSYEVVHPNGTHEDIFVPANDDMIALRYTSNGSLDNTFSGDGKVVIAFAEGKHDVSNGMVVQLDGKIVLAGGGDTDFALARLHSIVGFKTLENRIYTPLSSRGEAAYAVAVDSERRIVVGGYSTNDDRNVLAFGVARYLKSGQLDPSFSGDGKQIIDVGLDDAPAYAMALQPDGKILLAGTAYSGTNNDFAVVRLLPNGALDNTFDTDGKVMIPIKNTDVCTAIAMQSDGKIVMIGNSSESGSSFVSAVRLNPDGSLDTSFDTDGKVAIDVSSENKEALSLALYNDKILIGGAILGTGFFAFKLNANGSLDTGFSGDGLATINFGSIPSAGYSIAVQADGKVLLGGMINLIMTVLRLTAEGNLDNTFSDDGRFELPLTSPCNVRALIVQSDGKILASGSASNKGVLLRLNSNGTQDNTFGSGGMYLLPPIGNDNVINAIAVNPFGKIYLAGSHDNGSNRDFYLGVFTQCKTEMISLIHPDNDVTNAITFPYQAQRIDASNWLLNGAKAEYKAQRSIVLNPGFKAEVGAVFSTNIQQGCSYTLDPDDGPF